MISLDDMVETFELLGDWEQRYKFLMEVGEQLPPMPDSLKTEDNKVKGCMSQVWISPEDIGDGKIRFHGDCDTAIIKGVLALLIQLVSGRKAGEVDKLDVDEFFQRLRLDEHLSPNRHFGIYAIVEMMKKQTQELSSGKRD